MTTHFHPLHICSAAFNTRFRGIASGGLLVSESLYKVVVFVLSAAVTTIMCCAIAVEAQSADLNAMSDVISSMKKKAEAAALVLEEVMNRSSDLIESYKIARAEITLGEARSSLWFFNL